MAAQPGLHTRFGSGGERGWGPQGPQQPQQPQGYNMPPQGGPGGHDGWFAGPTTGGNDGGWSAAGPSGYPPHPMGMGGQMAGQGTSAIDDEDYSHEPPLLEELGINFDHIWTKTKSVVLPIKPLDEDVMDDADLAGPLFFCLAFGVFLLLTGKLHFGYIYGFGVSGCVAMYVVLNLLGSDQVDFWRVCSILGYCLLPVIGLAFLGVLISLKSMFGHVLAAIAIGWSTFTSTRFFEKVLKMSQQRWIVAYPVGLLYSVFVLITVF